MKPVLEGTVALVTGASSGIGAATAAALADQGAAVALAARRRDRLEQLAAGIQGRGGTVLVLECDVTDQAQAAAGQSWKDAAIFPVIPESALRATLGILARTVAPGKPRPAS